MHNGENSSSLESSRAAVSRTEIEADPILGTGLNANQKTLLS